MNISYNWLKDLVEFDLSPPELAVKLTGIGLAVEGVHAQGDDFVLDIDVTSNRADCLSHLGVAREIAAVEDEELIWRKSSEAQFITDKIENLTSVEVLDADLCPRYTARIIKNVTVGASPDWLVKRLEAVGERSINNVADITNFVMHELGQPLHAFDFEKLGGGKIVVRRAETGETMRTLDEIERKFDDSMLLICDAEKPVAIGGVMGGIDSGISEATTTVLIEAAYFRRNNVRQTSRKLNLATEASYRFERGTDIENVLRASNRCVEMICEICGGAATQTAIDVYPEKIEKVEIPFRASRIKYLTGLEVEEREILRILTALGFELKEDGAGDNLAFLAPTWRIDMEREEDLIEEIARHQGYDSIAEELPPAFGAGAYQPHETRKKAVRQSLADAGLKEALSYSFIDQASDNVFEIVPGLVDEFAAEKYVSLRDSIIEGATRMRPTLLPELLKAVRENFNYGNKNVRLFEIGKVFAAFGGAGALPTEKEVFAVVVTGGEKAANRAEIKREFDFYDAKAAVEIAAAAMNLGDLEFTAAKVQHLRDGQSAEIKLNNEKIGTIGRISDDVAELYKLKQAVFVAEIDLQKMLETAANSSLYQPLPNFPAISRDVSLLVKRSDSFGEIKRFIESQNIELLKKIAFVDVYEGKGIADDERSLTLRCEYRGDKTLRDEDAETAHQTVLTAIKNQFRAQFR